MPTDPMNPVVRDVPEMALDPERRRRILARATDRFRRRRRRRAGALLGVAAVLVVVASVTLAGQLHQPTTKVTVGPVGTAGASTAPSPSTGSSPASTAPGDLPEPTPEAVKDRRFVHTVALDGGALVVRPPAAGSPQPANETDARQQFWSTLQLARTHQTIVFGWGEVTLGDTVEPAFHVGAGTSRTLTAWVGFALGSVASCPNQSGVGTASTSVQYSLPGDHGVAEAAIIPAVFDAVAAEGNAMSVGPSAAVVSPPRAPWFVYTGTSSNCSSKRHLPAIEDAEEAWSIPWTLVSQNAENVTISYPRDCSYEVLSQTARMGPDGTTIAVIARWKFFGDDAPACPSAPPATATLSSAGTGRLVHAPTGMWNVVQGPGIPSN